MHRNYHDEEDDNDLDHDISDSSMEEEKFKFIDSRNDQENDHENDNFIPNFNTTSSDEDDTKYEGDPNRWNPMFGNILRAGSMFVPGPVRRRSCSILYRGLC